MSEQGGSHSSDTFFEGAQPIQVFTSVAHPVVNQADLRPIRNRPKRRLEPPHDLEDTQDQKPQDPGT